MQRRDFLRGGLLLGATGAVPGAALVANQLSDNTLASTGLVLPPLDDADTNNLLFWALLRKNPIEIINSLIEQGVDVNTCGELLHESIRLNIGEAIWEYLVSAGIDVNAKNNDGETPLHTAVRCWYFNDEAIKFLVSKGVDVHVKDNAGKTALDYVLEHEVEAIELMEILQDADAIEHQRELIQRLRKMIELLRRAAG